MGRRRSLLLFVYSRFNLGGLWYFLKWCFFTVVNFCGWLLGLVGLRRCATSYLKWFWCTAWCWRENKEASYRVIEDIGEDGSGRFVPTLDLADRPPNLADEGPTSIAFLAKLNGPAADFAELCLRTADEMAPAELRAIIAAAASKELDARLALILDDSPESMAMLRELGREALAKSDDTDSYNDLTALGDGGDGGDVGGADEEGFVDGSGAPTAPTLEVGSGGGDERGARLPTPHLSTLSLPQSEHNLSALPTAGRGPPPRRAPFPELTPHPPLQTGDGSSFKLDLSSVQESGLGEVVSFTGGISRLASLPPPPPVELPAGWDSAIDEVTGGRYYFNLSSGERTWEPPAALGEAVDPRSGRSYFYNHKTKERTARPKEMLASGRAPAMAASLRPRVGVATGAAKSTGALAAAQLAVAGSERRGGRGLHSRLGSG